MDNDTMMLLAKFIIHARRSIGAIDTNLLVKDATYRDSIFKRIDEQADVELLTLSLTLRNKLGMLTDENPATDKDSSPSPSGKYKFGARG